MIEIEEKYKIERKKPDLRYFRLIFFTLYTKEIKRAFNVYIQTLISPLVQVSIFLIIFNLAIGGAERGYVLNFPFIIFCCAGLIGSSVITSSYAHSSSSMMVSKINGTIIDILTPPISPAEVVTAIVLASVTRSFIIVIISAIVFSLFIDLPIYNLLYIFVFVFLGGFILGSVGLISGILIDKFEGQAAVSNFFIQPLSLLSGTFYLTEKLPEIIQKINIANPIYHIVNTIRFGFLGAADTSIKFGLLYLVVLSFIFWFVAYILFAKGVKIKN
jgi:ABC-2 type transport system permease protein